MKKQYVLSGTCLFLKLLAAILLPDDVGRFSTPEFSDNPRFGLIWFGSASEFPKSGTRLCTEALARVGTVQYLSFLQTDTCFGPKLLSKTSSFGTAPKVMVHTVVVHTAVWWSTLRVTLSL